MKTQRLLIASLALTVLSTLNSQLSTVFAQGSLTPPGAPAPTMKTLAQIEPRTPVDATHTPGDANNLFIISQSGSYYLTTNITGVAGKNGIGIQASNVCLDLSGFALMGGGTSSLSGIEVAGSPANIKICNGLVRDWGNYGVNTANAGGCEFDHLNATANAGPGLQTGSHSLVVNCIIAGNAGTGILTGDDCAVDGCLVVSNHYGIETGTGCRLSGCTANGNFFGIITGDSSSSVNCTASHCGEVGFDVGRYCNVLGCTANANPLDGILASDGCTIKDNTASSNALVGIVAGGGCTVVGCTADANGDGFSLSSESTISGCTASANNNDGILVTYSCQVKGNTTASNSRYVQNGGAGIHAKNSGNRIEGNVSNSDQYGIKVDGNENIITHNTVRAAGSANYNIVSGNMVGTIVNAPASGAINGGTGGSGLGTTDPWANFSY